MTKLEIRSYRESDEEAVLELWQACGLIVPWNDPVKDIHRKLAIQPEMFLVGILDGRLVGTVMAGYEGHRGWINYLAVAPDCRKSGYGRLLVTEAEALLKELGSPKINLQVRTSNVETVEFYRQLGYSIDDVVSMGKRLIQD